MKVFARSINQPEGDNDRMTIGSGGILTVDAALAWIAGMFEESRANIHAATARIDIPAWDSLGQLVLMSELDQRFGIRLSQAELSSLVSVHDILVILRKHGRLA